MKIVIFGDTHDNIANIKHVMGYAKKIKAEAIIHTGDWSSLKAYEAVKSYGIKIYGVLGNADISPEIKSKFKDFLEFEIDDLKIGLIHNIKKAKLEFFKNKDVVFTGHYHKQQKWIQKDGFCIRPGSLENNINFAILDCRKKMISFVSNNNYVD